MSCGGLCTPPGLGFPNLVLAISADGIYWDGEQVITREQARGLVGTLANAGIRSLTIVPGAELEEITRFLTVVHGARLLTPEDEDDLGTLLWEPLSGVGRRRPASEMLGFCVSRVGQRRWASTQFLAQLGRLGCRPASRAALLPQPRPARRGRHRKNCEGDRTSDGRATAIAP